MPRAVRSATMLLLLLAGAGGAACARPGAGAAYLRLDEEKQQASNWCWIASAKAVLGYWGEPARQCDLASQVLEMDCCADPSPCDLRGYVEWPIEAAGAGHVTTANIGTPSLPVMLRQLDLGRPLVLFYTRGDAEGHYVVLHGYDPDDLLYVYDPAIGGDFVEPVDSLDRYQDMTWTDTVTTFGAAPQGTRLGN